jgi:hypothetical protein
LRLAPPQAGHYPASDGKGEFSFPFDTGFMSTDLVDNELFVTAYYPAPVPDLGPGRWPRSALASSD